MAPKTLIAGIAIGIVAGVAGAFLLNSAFTRQGSAPAPGGPTAGGPPGGPMSMAVEAANVATISVSQGINAIGSLRSNESAVVRPEIAGRISAIRFAEGQPVAKGAVMIALDNSVQAAEFEQAKANLGLAQSNYTRNVELQKKGFVADRALDESRAALEVAKANLALAQAKLAKTEIRAPFAGVIGLRQVSEGDYVKEGQDLVNFEDISSLKVDFRMPEVYLGKLGKGQALGLESDAFKGEKFTAVVDAIDPLVDQSGRAVVLRAKLKNQGQKLRPGMFVRVNLIVDGKLDALAIPEEALVPVGEEQFVFKVVDGKVVRTRVKVGQRVGAQAVIMDGLAANDVVVTGGQLKLRDGVPVKIAPSAPLRGASAGADPSQGAGPPVAVAAPAQKAQ